MGVNPDEDAAERGGDHPARGTASGPGGIVRRSRDGDEVRGRDGEGDAA